MGARNCGELGIYLQKIITRLMANDNLVKLLYYTDKDPLNNSALSSQEKQDFIFEKLIKVVPKIGVMEDSKSIICVTITNGTTNSENSEFSDISIVINIFVPLTQYFIKDSNLRPFAILGEIQKSLNGKIINGLGTITGGDFDLSFTTEEVVSYSQFYNITSYD